MATPNRLKIAFVVLVALAVAAVVSNADNQQNFTGIMCDAEQAAAPGKSPDECVNARVEAGANFTLITDDDDDVYVLTGQEQQFKLLAGQRVTVVGTEDGDTIAVSSIFRPKR